MCFLPLGFFARDIALKKKYKATLAGRHANIPLVSLLASVSSSAHLPILGGQRSGFLLAPVSNSGYCASSTLTVAL
jgi:hypothetical protein